MYVQRLHFRDTMGICTVGPHLIIHAMAKLTKVPYRGGKEKSEPALSWRAINKEYLSRYLGSMDDYTKAS